jgi:prophage DNA circulation protein
MPLISSFKRYAAPWRLALVPATFRNVEFFMESVAYLSGRRIALHEYPKRDLPYAEDMGKRTRHFSIIGYLVNKVGESQGKQSGMTYLEMRDILKYALEQETSATLKVQQGTPDFWSMIVVVDTFSVVETKERGGYCVFDMHFVEAGAAANIAPTLNTSIAVQQAADKLVQASTEAFSNPLPLAPFVPNATIAPPPVISPDRR